MRLSIRHVTTYAYEPATDRCALRLRCYPSAFDTQQLVTWSLGVNGVAVPALLSTASGDRESIWTCNKALEKIEIVAEGEVDTADAAGVVRGLKNGIRPSVYLRETPLTEPNEKIAALAKTPEGKAAARTPLERLHALMHGVREAMDYKPGHTDMHTTAAQALKKGSGVCQDHAHVFIAAARSAGVPARYVVGYLLAQGTSLTETHAWAEAYVPDLGWVGFDPANRICPTERYVRLCSGLDSADAAPIRGNVSGAAGETLAASVAVSQTDTQSQTTQGQSQAQGQQTQ